MALSLTHTTAATGVDSADGRISKDAWNQAHTLTATDVRLLGTSGSTTVGEITVGSGLSLSAGALTATGGGGGTPAGSGTELQYRASGSFGAMSGTAWDDTNRSLTLTGATVTTSNPVLNLTQTWNAAGVTFTGLKCSISSTASAAASVVQDWLVGGSRILAFRKDGRILGDGANPYLELSQGNGTLLAWGTSTLFLGATVQITSPGTLRLSLGGTAAILGVDGSDILGQRNGAFAQTHRIYNTYTDSSNGEWKETTWSSNVCYARANKNGSGTQRLYVPVTGSTVVASLPSASTAGAGARSFVTDASATTFLSTVAGGGANKVPVVSDGTNWLIG